MKRLRVLYFIAANTAILFLCVQLGTDAGLRAYYFVGPAIWTPRLSPAVARNYAHMTSEDRDELLRTTAAVRFGYAPVVGFLHEPTTSRFVDIDEHGIRSNGTRRDIASMQGAVWFLGGSTAFGKGIADDETIPAQLEGVIGRPVVNLGARGYSSTEEHLPLNHYVRVGYRPSMAVFLDGINETCEPELCHEEMGVLVARAQKGYSWDIGGPVTYVYARINRKLKQLTGTGVENAADDRSLTCVSDGQRNTLRTIHARVLAERAALCRLYEIECRTLVQPFAGLHGRRDASDTTLREVDKKQLRELFGHLESNWREAGAISITDVLDLYDRHPFIDDVHYSAAASRLIAEAIAARLMIGANKVAA